MASNYRDGSMIFCVVQVSTVSVTSSSFLYSQKHSVSLSLRDAIWNWSSDSWLQEELFLLLGIFFFTNCSFIITIFRVPLKCHIMVDFNLPTLPFFPLTVLNETLGIMYSK